MSVTTGTYTSSDLTISRIVASNGSKELVSVTDLTTWVAGATDEIDVADDADGTITIGLDNSVNNVLTYIPSAGFISGFGITDNADGTIDIAEGVCYLRTSNSDTAPIKEYTIAATPDVALTDTSDNWVYVDYNSGTPQIAVTTTSSDIYNDENSKFELYEIHRDGNDLNITTHFQISGNATKHLNQYLYEKGEAERTSGLIIGETGTRNITMTTGVLWLKLNKVTISAKDTSGSDTYSTWYNTTGTWTKTPSVTQWDNLQYNDTTSGLVTLTNNRWSFFDVFVWINETLHFVYGQDEYTTQSLAENATVITTLPNTFAGHTTYIARVIFQKSASTLGNILNPFTDMLGYTVVTNHDALSGLTDDDHTQYVTLTNRTGETLDIDNIILTGETATRLLATDGSKQLSSVTDLTSWIAGTTNEITVTDDADGTVTLSLPATVDVGSGTLKIDNITESTGDHGIDVETVHFEDGKIHINGSTEPTLCRFNITGTVNSATDCPGVMHYFTGDSHPGLQILPFNHDNISISFDAYWNGGGWASSDAGSNFQMGKANDAFTFWYDSEVDAGSGVTWNAALKINLSNGIYSNDLSGNAMRPLMIKSDGEIGHSSTAILVHSDDLIYMVDTYGASGISDKEISIRSDGLIAPTSSILASKTNILDLDNIDWLYQVRPRTFNFRKKVVTRETISEEDGEGEMVDRDVYTSTNDYSETEYHTDLRYGMIAEELEVINDKLCTYHDDITQVTQDCVRHNEDAHPEYRFNQPCTCTKTKTLDGIKYKEFIPILIKAIQDQKTLIANLTTRVNTLEGL